MARRLTLALFLTFAPALARAEPPLRVTTVNDAYCQVLLERISATPGVAGSPAAQLAQEGAALCANGHPRAGIAKLRRALRVALAEAP